MLEFTILNHTEDSLRFGPGQCGYLRRGVGVGAGRRLKPGSYTVCGKITRYADIRLMAKSIKGSKTDFMLSTAFSPHFSRASLLM